MDDRAREAHSRLASLSLNQIVSSMPSSIEYLAKPSEAAGYVLVEPEVDHDPKKAIIVPLQYNRDWDKESAVRIRLFRDILSEPTKIIVFPNRMIGHERPYDLSRYSLDVIFRGNFSPLAKLYLRTIEELGIEQFSIVGFSQGATLGAATLKEASDYFQLNGSALIDPPNTVDRTCKKLINDFESPGIHGLLKAIRDVQLPPYSEASFAYESAELLIHLAAFDLSSKLEPNHSIEEGFTWPNFESDLKQFFLKRTSTKLLVASGSESKIAPTEVMRQIMANLSDFSDQLNYLNVFGYGHEICSNILVCALIGRLAVEGNSTTKR